ncbi:hypothetical protein BGX28_007605 [Mortierella sp. GBA30]|nr:hypothetical protein BGX28_007605 [Mortierella sp. GBA30]
MKSLTAALESDISTPVETLEVLPTDERQMLLREWNLTHRDYPDLLCLQHLFEQQAERTPDAIAVVHGNLSVTYAELNNRANHLAHKLIQLGVKPDSLVAICAERSPAMIIGILAILKAGGAYVPLDPFYSSDRLRDVINDAAPSILLADNVGRQALGNTTLASLTVLDPNTQDPSAARNPRIIGMTSQHLAYVIYTSGSTGKPKGVMIEHRGVVNLITFRSNMFEIHPRSRVLQFTSLSFDHSVSEIFTTLTRGASLHLVHDDIRLDRQRLWDLIQQSSISHVSFTPSLLQDCKNMPVLDTLRTLVVMGEALPPTLPAVLRRIAPCSSIFNGYGPTEISISASVWKCPMEFREEDVVSIGRPLPNKSIYLLDVHGDPVPLGAIGEMYVGGVGVARGYLNQPGLTSERFVLDPFSEDSNARMYRTGDMARYLPDGNLVCLGRCDHQVKIRGFRIELGEIEAQLAGHPIVSESVVVAPGEGSNKRLIAYVVVRHDALNNQNLQEAQLSSAAQRASMLRSYLRERLPEYMVPAAFVHLDALPLTSNGKLDRRALPDPGEDDFARQEYEAPQGGIESALASIWTDLLHVERVSRHDSFFALGGHSLLAVQLVSRLHRLGHSISVRSLFESPTLSVLAQSIGLHRDVVTPPNLITRGTTRITPEMLPLIDLNQTDIDLITERVPGGVANVQDIYALSPLQDGILFHHLMAKSGDPYVLYTSLSFDTRATLDQYLAAVEQIVNRHDVLRTSFLWQDLSTPAQVVMREAPLSITELKLDPAAGPIAEQLKQMFDPRSHRMDLTQAPLLRFIAAQESDGRWILFGLQHHLVGDHSTLDIMLTEIQTFCKGAEGALPPAQPYRNLIAQARLGVSQEEHEKFFKEMLAEVDTPSLPFDITDIHGDGIQVSEVERTLPQDLNNRLRWQARRLGISVASLCHVAWAQVIERTSGQQRVVFGTVLFGRMQAATSLDGAMGLFINTLPIRVDLDTDNVEGTVRATHARLAGLLEHEHASLALAQHCSGVAAGAPLFSSLLNYRHNSTSSNDYEAMKGMKLLESEERTNYPFCLSVEDYGTSLGLTAQVVQPLDPGRICGYMQQALDSLADALEHNPSMSVANLEVIPKCELQMLLRDWNITQEDDPDHHCIHHWFEHQVEHTPEAIAVVYKDQSLTYGELNERANRLAYRLVKLGVQPDSLVAICVERSLGMIIGILAILKAGGAYVPLDPAHASERLLGILSDASPSILVADTYGTAAVAEADLSMLTLVDPNGAYEGPTINPRIPTLSSHHLAYVIYTSGSTGKPKGCMVEHRQVVRLFTTTADWYNFNQQDTWCLFHSFAFDFSVWEIWGALRVGGRVVIAPQDTVRSLQDLRHLIHEHSITVLNTTPSIFTSLIECDIGDGLCDSLRYLIFGGEPLAPAVLQSWFTRPVKNRTQAVHVYGITETTVLATHRRMIPEDCTLPSLPIGLRFNDLRMYVLDNRGQPVPIGAVGELYVGGAGVTRGYLNRPELTAERFLRDPFVEDPEARMYRSGDLVRYLPDGNLVYVGRNDHQVKLRGFRIELGEIQARLSEHPLVSDCVVLVIGEEDNKRLVAYVAAKPDVQSVNGTDGETLQLALALRTHLAARLPEYMVPSAFVQLDALPLNGNGKVDRRALPEPSHDSLAREAFEEPQGEIEVALAAIWADLLRLDRVSRHDSFFALGGHSLLAVRMMNRVATLGANVPLTTLFASPCLYAFADEIKSPLGEKSTHLPPIEPVPRTEMMPLSFEQQRMWFLAQLDGVSDTYHVPMAMRLRGVLNREAFQRAMSDLFERHEALRSVFVDVNGQSYMRILTPEGIHVEYIDLQHEVDINGRVAELVAKEIHTSFDLVQGPLIRATIIQTAHNDHVLVLNQHHIISDGWSIAIMTRELSQLYSAYVNGGSNPLPPLEVQYPDYAAWQRQWFSGDRLKSQADYWRSALAGVPVLIDLPTDRPRPPRQSFAGSRVPIAVDAELTTSLKRLSQKHGVTMFMTILAAWSVVLSRLSGQDDIVIGTPTANRGRHEIETMIGLFVNTLALRVDLSAEPTMRNLLDRVRRSTLAAYEHQDIPFEQVVEIVQPPRRMDHTPLFQVMFSWQNTEVDEWIMPGLQADAFNLDYEVLKYDLELDLYEENGEIVGSLSYSTALFDQTTIERYIGYLHTTLQTLSDNVDQSIASIDILSPAERTLLLQTWNATHQDPPTNECIHRLFEKQVQRLPQAVALVHGEVALTYTELNERANQLAHLLIELGVHPDARVAICVERSLAMVIGTLAILKAGGAFVPLDPAYASERLRTILMDAAPTVLIADSAGLAALGQANLSSMTVVDPNRPLSYASTNTHAPGLTSRHLAYIIYTSGSTGKPKGVMIEHRGVSDLAQTHTKFCGIREGSRVMQFASFSFDASVWDIMLPLSSGGALYLPPDCIRMDRDALWNYMAKHSITLASFTPSFLQDGKDLPPLNNPLTLVLGGEALSQTLLQNLIRQGITVINDYGPTEVTVSAATWRCPQEFHDNVVPIGRPVIHSRLYLLDLYRQPVPLGAVGELYVGGVAVARGYLNRPELTNEMFIPDPYADEMDAKMYRTGDLARYLPDGNLVYLGRKDNQVKIRGFRIELGEIEAVLLEHHAVSEAVVLVLGEANDKRLVAYVVLSEPLETLTRQLRAHVSAHLPRYMVPETFVRLDTMPLTSNDKLDRKALPTPEYTSLVSETYEIPLDGQIDITLDPTQLAIHTIWKQLLPSSPTWIPLTENFFDLGGHSILATRLIFEVRRVCCVDVPLSLIFREPTIGGMAKEVDRMSMDSVELEEADKSSSSSKETAVADQEEEFDYSGDFEELCRTEIDAVYGRVERQDKVDHQTFFLTGATGFLGTFILSNLLSTNPTARVICLARASSEEKALDRVRACGEAHLTWNEEWIASGRLLVVAGDLSLERFGLSQETWDKCCRQVDIIIHNGALVNGVFPYTNLRAANVLGTLQGIKMASTYHTKSFHFVSSTSVLDTTHYRELSSTLARTTNRGVPETDDLEGARHGLDSGYGQSKWVAEKLIMAANKNGLPATIIRPGYILGHTRTGVTNTGDFIWRLIKGCVEVGSAPSMNAAVNICPVDYVAQCVVSVATSPGSEAVMVYQVTHPTASPFRFNDFFQILNRYGYEVLAADYSSWRRALTDRAIKSQDTALYTLLHMVMDDQMGTTESPELSDVHTQRIVFPNSTFDATPRMNTELVGRYLAFMIKIGFLNQPILKGENILALPDIEDGN